MDKKLLVNLGLDVIMVGCSFACGACVASYVNMKKFKKHLSFSRRKTGGTCA